VDFGEVLSEPQVNSDDIKKLVNRHNQLIQLSSEIESIISPILLANFLKSSLIICLIGFGIVMSCPEQRVIFIQFFVVHVIQIFLTCFYAQKLMTSSENVANSVYSSNWHSIIDKKVRKMMILILRRCQRPCKLTTMGFYAVSHETFTKASKRLVVII
jgi:hypothetical protein